MRFFSYLTLLSILVLSGTLCFSGILHAEDLDSIMDKEKKRELLENQGTALLKMPDPASTYGQMLEEEFDLKQLISWVTTGYEEQELVNIRASHDEDDFLFAEADIRRSDLEPAHMLLVIPRPQHQIAAQYGLLKPYIRARPIKKDILTMKKFTVSGHTAELYHLRRNECRMIVNLPHQGMLKIDAEKCKSPGAFFLYEKELTLERLIRKLLS